MLSDWPLDFTHATYQLKVVKYITYSSR